MAIFEWIEGWYNPHRRHSGIGRLSPNNFERRISQQQHVEMS
jgi:putative transposase